MPYYSVYRTSECNEVKMHRVLFAADCQATHDLSERGDGQFQIFTGATVG